MISADFWQGKRVFLTGHTGFKGSWLSLWLLTLGAELHGYSLEPPTEPSLYKLLDLGHELNSSHGDIRDLPRLMAAVRDSQPDLVIHMAAQPLVRHSYMTPVETYETNVMGTVNLLEAVRQVGGVRALLVVTSDKCYQNNEWVWGYRENEPMGGHDPYSSSKGCAELVTAAYRSSFFPPERLAEHGVAVASARAGNVIGGGDWAKDRLIPDLIRGFMAGAPVTIRHPDAVRPWQHVLEPLSGYLTLSERLYRHDQGMAEGWNFGPRDQDAKPVGWVANRLATLWGERPRWVLDRDHRLHEAHHLKLDWSKAHAKLGWKPIWSIPTSLERTVSWYKAYQSDSSPQAVHQSTLADIEAYMASLSTDPEAGETEYAHAG